MPRRIMARARAYGIGLLGVAVVSVIRLQLDPLLEDHLSFGFFFLPVAVAAWAGGVLPAIVTATLSALVASWQFTAPQGSFRINDHEELFSLLLFLVVSLVIGVLSEFTRQALQRARVAEKHKNEFLSILAHELRNPLAAMENAAQLIRSQNADERDSAADAIAHLVRHMGHVIGDLADTAQIVRGKLTIMKEPVDGGDIVTSALATASPLFEARQQTVECDICNSAMPLEVDRTRLEQVLINLLSNAAKYTPEQGTIWLSAHPDGGHFRVSVKDNGSGIPRHMLRAIFEPFTQAHRSHGDFADGLGLGLAVVQKIVHLHGGRITVHSDGPGKGSEFVVCIPLEQDYAERVDDDHRPEREGAEFCARDTRILVVDDDRTGAGFLSTLLANHGFVTHVAHDGPSALDAAREFEPEIVLLDISLPGMSGYRVAECLRDEESLKDLIIIGLSGHGREEDRNRARESGFDDHLTKPVAFDSLLARLRSLETSKHAHAAAARHAS